MSTNRFATIDVGTNTLLLLVAERRGNRFVPLRECAEITRLGRGVDRTGRLDAAAIQGTVEVLARYVNKARELGAEIVACVATSAARDARNGSEFFDAAQATAGLIPAVISGEEEARLVYGSAWRDFGSVGSPLTVLDVGGGSTEFTWGDQPEPLGHRSLPIGAVRLTERIVDSDPIGQSGLDRLRTEARDALRELRGLGVTGDHPLPKTIGSMNSRFVAVAGTVTTLAAVHQVLPYYDAAKVHGSELTRRELEALFNRLGALTVAERARLAGMEPKRADVIVAGCAIVIEVMRVTGVEQLTVSDRGVRWGLLYDRVGSHDSEQALQTVR